MIIVILVLAALLIPLVIGSVFVCVPKWWTKSVSPRIPNLPRLPNWLPEASLSPAAGARILLGLKIIVFPILFSVILVIWLIRGWFVIGLAAIEGACPYNGGFEWRDCLSDWFDAGTKPLTDLSGEDVFGAGG